MKKAYSIARFDRCGSKVNEDLFVYAHCIEMLNNNADSQVRMHITLREQFEEHCLNKKRTQGKKKRPPQYRGHGTS